MKTVTLTYVNATTGGTVAYADKFPVDKPINDCLYDINERLAYGHNENMPNRDEWEGMTASEKIGRKVKRFILDPYYLEVVA